MAVVSDGATRNPNKLFVAGLQHPTTDESLSEYFSTFGVVEEAVIKFSRAEGRAAEGRAGPPRGYGFVTMRDESSVVAILQHERHELDGYAIPKPRRRTPQKASSVNLIPIEPRQWGRLFVGGIPHDMTKEDLRVYFGQFGSLLDVIIMYDHKINRPRGFGFVVYAEPESVQAVLASKPSGFHRINGRVVEVKLAVPRHQMQPVMTPMSAVPAGAQIAVHAPQMDAYTEGTYGAGGYSAVGPPSPEVQTAVGYSPSAQYTGDVSSYAQSAVGYSPSAYPDASYGVPPLAAPAGVQPHLMHT